MISFLLLSWYIQNFSMILYWCHVSSYRVWTFSFKKRVFCSFWGANWKIGVKTYFGHNPLIFSIEYRCENHFLGLKSHPKPFKYAPLNQFWYPKQYLRAWRKLEKSSKIAFFPHFGQLENNWPIFSIEYRCENHFLGLKSHPKLFKHAPIQSVLIPQVIS